MASNSDNYHEPFDLLSEETRTMHRAIVSVMEELEAIDWYQQRANACTDEDLKKILLHNRREEMEHAMMGLEWIRRHDDDFNEKATLYLFTEGPITKVEEKVTGGGETSSREEGENKSASGSRGALGIGGERGRGA